MTGVQTCALPILRESRAGLVGRVPPGAPLGTSPCVSQHLGVDRELITLCADEFLFETAQEVPSIALGERPRSRISFSRLRFVLGHRHMSCCGVGGGRTTEPRGPSGLLCPGTGDGCVAWALPDTCSCWCVSRLEGSFSLSLSLSLPPHPSAGFCPAGGPTLPAQRLQRPPQPRPPQPPGPPRPPGTGRSSSVRSPRPVA